MARIEILAQRKQNMKRLLEIWESVVRKTHTFLSENDILSIKPEVPHGLEEINHLYCFFMMMA